MLIGETIAVAFQSIRANKLRAIADHARASSSASRR